MTTTSGLIAIDADGHVHEENILFTEYLDPAYRHRTGGWALNADNNAGLSSTMRNTRPFHRKFRSASQCPRITVSRF